MILNIISTVNGKENEGMRNIATHMTECLAEKHTLRSSALGKPFQCIKNSIGADAVIIFARAFSKTAILARILRLFCKRVYFILVQKPEKAFFGNLGRVKHFGYFTLVPADGEEIRRRGGRVRNIPVGINKEKFRPAISEHEKFDIRRKYGFENDMPLVLHVGHMSVGRGLEEFLRLPKDKYQRVVVASGMFNDATVEKILTDDGVHIIKEYLPDVSEVYRMADVYFFPTVSAEYVISMPLSVTEALSCGIPAVALKGVPGIDLLSEHHSDAVYTVSSPDSIEEAVDTALTVYFVGCRDLLRGIPEWSAAADVLAGFIGEDIAPAK